MTVQAASVRTLTIGSRGSALALWQANHVAELLNARSIETRIEIIKTTGDHLQTASLTQAGGKGLFTKEIEQALLDRSIDIAVHSLKDLPTEMTPGLTLAAVPAREDPRDALIGATLAALPRSARIGTSSSRRGAQLRYVRPDLVIEPVRGNVDTRLRKLKEGQYDAIVLAAAGLKRLGFDTEIAEILSPEQSCPAPGQGALGIQTRVGDAAEEICRELDDADTHAAVEAERTVLAGLGGGCQLPIGAFAEKVGTMWSVMGIVIAPDGSRLVREKIARSGNPVAAAMAIVQELLARGAAQILSPKQ
ncbi:MAG: hydroxymethylbilane synthase [Acetobacteraceae bacterium]|nr:hydroxymethylbilane synthase [Acetobacteraceae bacterium]